MLFYSTRDTATRTYINQQQVKLTAKHISELQLKALELFGTNDSTVDSMRIAKHIPHMFKWSPLDPNEELTIK